MIAGRAAALSEPFGVCQAALPHFSCKQPDNAYIGVMNRHQTISSQSDPGAVTTPSVAHAHFGIGDVVQHRLFGFRGVVFDIDAVFANTDEWYEAIPENMRPAKEQPFYHLLAENSEGSYIAYVSQQNLVADESGEPVDHPAISGLFGEYEAGKYALRPRYLH